MQFSQELQRLDSLKRLKFLNVDGKKFVYNCRDSILFEIESKDEYAKRSDFIKVTSPPLKTLILHSTYNCNLSCKHCYIDAGRIKRDEMSYKELRRIVKEFGEMGGLGIDISGGEPLVKKGIEKVIAESREQRLRTILLTNATNLDKNRINSLSPYLDGMAVGLDGLKEVNDKIRGKGSFSKIINGLEIIAGAGLDLSITTAITKENIPQLIELPELMEKYGARSWCLVLSRPSGRFADKRESINLTYKAWENARSQGLLNQIHEETKKRGISVILDHVLVPGSKRRMEESSVDFVYEIYNKGRACWDNTLTIMPNGDVKCCLFFDGQVYDNVRNKSLIEVYKSKARENALNEFKKFPIDICPLLEEDSRIAFEGRLK